MNAYTPPQLRAALDEVKGHVLELHARWRLFRKLYRGNEDSQPVLAAVASEMFWVLGRLLHRGSLLLFRQLTDGPASMGHRNASFEGLLEAVSGPMYKTNHPDLFRLITDLKAKKSIREHVNKYIAHLDFDLLAGISTKPSDIPIGEFEDALRLMREFMNRFGRQFFNDVPTEYDTLAELMADQADNLVANLRKTKNSATLPSNVRE
jgi:hypothetical protein